MAKIIIDGPNKLFRVNQDVTNIDVGSELYSEWKRWLLLDDNAKYLQAFRTDGGSPTNPEETQFGPRYYFLMNGWRVYVDGNAIVFQINLYTDEGDSPFVVVNGGAVTNRASDVPNIVTDLPEIKYSSYGDVVTLDIVNGKALADELPGEIVGSKRTPVDNADDAVFIGADAGLDTISVIGNYSFTDTDVLDDYIIKGQNAQKTWLHFPELCSCQDIEIRDCYVTGDLDGVNILRNSVISTLSISGGILWECMINPGIISLYGTDDIHLLKCMSGQPGTSTPTIDCANGNNPIGIRGYEGGIQLINKTGDSSVSIDMTSGQIKLEDTVTQGTIVCRGVGKITDNTIDQIGLDVLSSDLLNSHNIANSTLNTDLSNYSTVGTAGESLRRVYYNGMISIDSVNGSAGNEYPIGTRNNPVSNISDAFILSQKYKIYTFGFSHEEYTFISTDNLRGYSLFSQSGAETLLSFEDGCNTENCVIDECSVTGHFNGRCTLRNCMVLSVINFEGWMFNCGLNGGSVINFAPNNQMKSVIQDCQTIGSINDYPILDFQNIGTEDVTIKSYTGKIQVSNKLIDQYTSLVLTQGVVVIDNTCIDGYLKIAGNGTVIDNNNGTVVDYDNLMNADIISNSVWDEQLSEHTDAGSAGDSLANISSGANPQDIASAVWEDNTALKLLDDVGFIRDIEGGRWRILNNQMIFFKEDNVTEIARFNLVDENGYQTSENVFERIRQ